MAGPASEAPDCSEHGWLGLSWIPEEFTWTRTDMRTRGKRADEMIEILKLLCAGNSLSWFADEFITKF